MAVVLRANTELVTEAWLSTVDGMPAGAVATTLPADNSTWAASGFVTVGPTVGGQPDVDVPMRRPVVQVDCWAVNPESRRPPWGRANWLAELIVAACYDTASMQRTLTLRPPGFPSARVLAAYPVTEPRRVPSDPAAYARYHLDLQVDWIELPA